MSNLENKLKKIIDTFNNVNKEIAFNDIKKLSKKYNKNLSVQNVLFQISKKVGDIDTSINALKTILFIDKNNIMNEKYSTDGVHLNKLGYQKWIDIIYPVLSNIK